jgi:ribulose-phosphate 3-epimerase
MMCANLLRLGDEICAVESAGADVLHMDVMDGHFVPGFTFGSDVVRLTKSATSLPVEVHLMSDQPMRHMDEFLGAGADALIIHVECERDGRRWIERIRARGARCGIALNPATPASAVDHLLGDVDSVLVMTVETGTVGSPFIQSSLDKAGGLVSRLRERGLDHVEVIVDGGVKLQNVAEIARAGVHQVVSGSGIFHRGNPADILREMKQRAATAEA